MRIQKFILLCLISFYAYNATSQKVDNLNLKLDLDKSEYNKGDTVKLLITNTSSDTLYIKSIDYNSECIKLKVKKGQEWEQLIVQGYSGGLYHGALYPLLPKEQIHYQWSQIYKVPNEIPFKWEYVEKGIYRFEFYYQTFSKYPEKIKDFYVAHSKEFEVK